PDYFNWPAQLATVAAEQDHEAFVFFVGANDTQGMELDGRVLAEGSDEWRAEYQRRVAFTMDVLAGEGRHLFWVLQPPVRDGSEQPTVVTINQAIRAAAEGRTGVTLIESDVLFADASGGYAAE